MSIAVKAFQCEYCRRKVMMNRTHLESHERVCFSNPRRRACQTCGKYRETSETFYNRYHGGNPGSTDYEYNVRYCQAEVDIKQNLQSDCPAWKPRTKDYDMHDEWDD